MKPDIKKEKIAALRPKTLKKLDRLFENPMADIADTNDINLMRAQSIPLAQRIRNRESYTDYVRSAAENEAYCLYEGGC